MIVDGEQCRELARHLRTLRVRADPYLRRPGDEAERYREANYWLYITAICQSTRTFEGTINGRWLRGWTILSKPAGVARRTFGLSECWRMGLRS